MISLRWLCIIILISIFVSCNSQIEKPKPNHYICLFTEREITIDGFLDEAQWKDTDWSDDFVDIEGSLKPRPYLQTNMKMRWSKNYLYIAVKMEESHLWATLTSRDAIIYHDNDFEVFIDPDRDGLNYYELEINAFGTEFDLFLNKPYNKKGKANISWDFKGIKSAVQYSGTLNDPSDTDEFWTIEIAIPWEAFTANDGLMPNNGDYWKMNFSRVQWNLEVENNQYVKKTDSETGLIMPENNWVWSPQGTINMHIPEKWGLVEFTGYHEKPDSEIPEFWIWSGAYRMKSEKEWDSTLNALSQAGISGILMAADSIVLKRVIPIADRYNMQVHAWFVTMNNAKAKPEWLSVNHLGKSLAEEKAYVDYYKFMCPALPEVKGFIESRMDALSKIEGLKGIHMDYIRYVDVILPEGLWEKYDLVQDHIMPEFDYGYHPYMRQLYEDKYGMDPLAIENIEHDSTWLNFRLDILNETVIDLRDQVSAEGLDITAAVFPTPEVSREMVRQDWDKWGLDYYFPMVYHSFYKEDIDWIRNVMEENKAVVPKESKVFCGLFLPALKENNDLTKAVKVAYAGGADGIAFFDMNALTTDQLQQIKALREQKSID